MAQFDRRPGGWLARVRKGGVSKSAVFRSKAEAQAWAADLEREIRAGKLGIAPDKTVAQLVEKYIDEVVPLKAGAKPEEYRFRRLMDDALGKVKLAVVNQSHIAQWRDRRLQEVSGDSVIREWTSLSAAFTKAIKEWRWLSEHPMRGVERPDESDSRTRVMTDDEITRLIFACGYDYDIKPESDLAMIGAALLFALETAIRQGEIVQLEWQHLHLGRRVMHLPGKITKNRHPRDVPLSTEAMRLIEQMRGLDDRLIFPIPRNSFSTRFSRVVKRCLIEDLHFHDSRRTALTRMVAKGINVMDLAKISGHRDLRILQNTYYTPEMGDLAARLD
jgi:integrase